MDYVAFGQRVRTLRLERKLTQEQLAEVVGLSTSFLGHIERGSRVPSLETLVALCRVLEVSPEYLLACDLAESRSISIPPEFRSKAQQLLDYALFLAKE